MTRSELDHLIVGCADLDTGVRWVEAQLGVAPVPGGRHVAMGTHNALLRLGARCYLEVIAVDPETPAPARPRWLSLDEPDLQAQLDRSPGLIAWVVRTESLANACARVPDLGEILTMSRNQFRWKISVPDSGSLPWGGVLPVAIEWLAGDDGIVRHPCDVLTDSGCELVSLQLSHPAAVLGTSGIVALFRDLKILGPVDLQPGPRTLAATIRSPRGEIVLS
jgi:hypothetical protein